MPNTCYRLDSIVLFMVFTIVYNNDKTLVVSGAAVLTLVTEDEGNRWGEPILMVVLIDPPGGQEDIVAMIKVSVIKGYHTG